LGYSYKSDQISDLIVAEQTDGIDVIIGGHTHTFLDRPTPVKNKSGQMVLVSQAGWAGLRLGRLDLTFSPKGQLQNFDSSMNEISKKTIGF
jgi:5'-nucleotidase